MTVYQDERFTLGERGGEPFLIAGGKRYTLSCHPYEPCLYIRSEDGRLTAVHNAFDPHEVLASFAAGKTVFSITGREYGAKDFCQMVESAARAADLAVDDAERVFGGEPGRETGKTANRIREGSRGGPEDTPETRGNGRDDPFCEVVREYPDSALDILIVDPGAGNGSPAAHRAALALACGKLFADENGEVLLRYDAGKACAAPITAGELFAPVGRFAGRNYRGAFLDPPHGSGYTDADFDRLNALLFPEGTDALGILKWTTDWSEYFDDGNEWWGALCLTVYDAHLDRFVVILASATD